GQCEPVPNWPMNSSRSWHGSSRKQKPSPTPRPTRPVGFPHPSHIGRLRGAKRDHPEPSGVQSRTVQVDSSGHTDLFHWLNSWLQNPSFSNISRVSLYFVSSRPSITSRIALRVAALGMT